MSLRGPSGRGNLPVQLCGYMGTDVEATPYREIPTDGTAVLGMTYFYIVASFFTSPAGRQGGRWMTAPTWNIVHLCRGGVPPPANGTGNPSPTRATHQKYVIARPIGPWQSPGTILRPHRHRCRGNPLPGDSHGRHSRPRNDIFFQDCVDFYISFSQGCGWRIAAPAQIIAGVRKAKI